MRKLYTLVCVSFSLAFFGQNILHAQCGGGPCGSPVPAVNAQDACILPNPGALDCYFGATTFDQPVSLPPSWCTSVENNHWFAFIADAPTASFDICTFGCAEGTGIQAAVLSTSDCITFAFESACLGGINSGTCQGLVANGLTVGETYYIMIDGSAGSVCDYSINGVNPTINGPTTPVCLPSSLASTYNTNTLSQWTINPPSAGTILGNPVSNVISVTWNEPGPAEVCAMSLLCPDAPNLCIPIFIGEDVTTTEDVQVCQSYTVECAGVDFSTAGTFPVSLLSYLGCDSVVRCVVHVIPTVTTTENVRICLGGSTSCAGQEFDTPGTFPVTLTGPSGCDSIVRCVVTIIPTYVSPTNFVTLCGPAEHQVCGDTYNETGFITQICTGYLGCDSIVNVDLAVLEPVANIAPPAILDCGANLIITLNGTGSNVNNATSGSTFYTWSGPGILGFNNQPTVQVNQPGEYCLILRHSRGGISCADTTCVTVQQNAGIPQLPVLTGVQNPCSGQTLIYTATATGNPPPTSFVWTLPGNHPFTPIPPSNIEVSWMPNTPTGQICVTANNSCGASPPACIPVSVGDQPIPPVVSGPASVCTAGGAYLFTMDTLQPGTQYNWTVPAGAVLTGSGDSIMVNFATAVSGQVCVTAQNACDTLPPTCLNVQVVTNPTADLSGILEICSGESLNLNFALTGNGPFDVVWSNGTQNFTLNDILNGHQISVSPSSNTTYSLVSVSDNSTPACATLLSDNVPVAVWPLATTPLTVQICEGQTAFLAGAAQSNPGVYMDSLSSIHGCDSVIVTTLIVNAIDTTVVALTTCDPAAAGSVTQILSQVNGCDSIVTTTTTLLPSHFIQIFDNSCDPANVGVFTQNLTNVFGCDSTVVTTVAFSNSDTTLVSATTCDPAGVGVFNQLLVAASDGCDSLVITTVTLLPSNTVNLTAQSCNPAEVGVFTTVLPNQFGCDSTIITTVSFNGIPPTPLTATTCNANAAGVFTNIITTAAGCDSALVTTVTFVGLPPTLLSATTCDPAAAGVFTNVVLTADGCDSTIITTVSLLPSSATALTGQSCNPAEVGVFTEVLPNQFGCDSTVVTTITFNGIPPTLLSTTTCDPALAGTFTQNITTAAGCDSAIVTTVVLLPSNTTQLTGADCDPTKVGVFTQDLTNQFGCDSTVITTISLLPSNTTALQSTSCDPAAIGVFVFPLVNQFGCDSIVTETVTLLPSSATTVNLGTCEPTQVGTSVAVLSNQFGCDSTVTTITSLLAPAACGMTASLSGSIVPCGSTTGTLVLTATLGEGPFLYTVLMNNNAVANGSIASVGAPTTVSGLAPGNYTVNYSSSNGFSATAQATIVQLFPPSLNAAPTSNNGGFGVSCPGASDGSVSAAASGGLAPYNYVWSTGTTGATVNDLAAGVYQVTVTDANNCTTIATTSLSEPAPLKINFTVNDPKCFGNNNGSILVGATGGIQPYRFALNDGIAQNSNVFAGLGAGSYTIKAFDGNDCETSEIILVNTPIPLSVDLGDDIEIELGDSATLQAIVNVPFDSLASVIWTPVPDLECPDCLTQTVVPLVSTSYSIQIVDNKGCKDEDKVVVKVDRRRYVYIPNVFTPDNDGDNDIFSVFPRPGTVRKVRSLAVYDRWGETLYINENFNPYDGAIGWDGTFKGEPMNPAVFVWVVEIEYIDGVVELYKGDVTIVR